jgi:cytochrome P450
VNPEIVGTFVADDYYEQLARLRRDEPVHRYAPNRWTIARYDDIRAISRDPERFCSSKGVLINDPLSDGGAVAGSFLHIDPPEHAEWRKLTSRRFTPRAIGSFEDEVRALARETLDAIPPGEEIDFVDRVAAVYPVLVIAQLLGVADGNRDDFRRWSDAAIEAPDDPVGAMADVMELFTYLKKEIRARVAEPRDDIATAVSTAEISGCPMPIDGAVGYMLTLLVAGNETTRHLVSGSVATLFEHPEQRALLAREPERIPVAVEECLRWVTPIQAFGRTATVDTEVGGQTIPAGDFAVMLYASGNRDEDAFGPTAGAFDVTRPVDNSHVAFGFGEHLCLGAGLARLEARIFLEELLARYPNYELTAPPELSRSTLVRGAVRMPFVAA